MVAGLILWCVAAVAAGFFAYQGWQRFLRVAWKRRREPIEDEDREEFFAMPWCDLLFSAVGLVGIAAGILVFIGGERSFWGHVWAVVGTIAVIYFVPALAIGIYQAVLRIRWALDRGELVGSELSEQFRGPVHLLDD